MFLEPSKSRERNEIWNIGLSKTSDHIKIKIKIPNPSQEPPGPSKGLRQDLKEMDVLCTFRIKSIKPKANHCKAELVLDIDKTSKEKDLTGM